MTNKKQNTDIEEFEKEFFERFGANKIWVVPSRDNVETVLDIWQFINKALTTHGQKMYERAMEDIFGIIDKHHEQELRELMSSDNRSDTKEYIRKGLEVYKKQLIKVLQARNK